MNDFQWHYTNDFDEASELLNSMPDTIACDFETASMYTDTQKAKFSEALPFASKWPAIKLRQKIKSDGLSHPALTTVTHFSFAPSRTEGYVIILDTDEILEALMDWLVTDTRKQIWHNFSFDGRHIMHHTGKLPIDFEDSQILAKTLLNHVETYKANTGLKQLMGWEFGSWSLADTPFNLSNIYSEDLLRYAAIDAAATFGLWEDIQNQLKGD
jgi:hypothetical protein